jgi:hypothetical protein
MPKWHTESYDCSSRMDHISGKLLQKYEKGPAGGAGQTTYGVEVDFQSTDAYPEAGDWDRLIFTLRSRA